MATIKKIDPSLSFKVIHLPESNTHYTQDQPIKNNPLPRSQKQQKIVLHTSEGVEIVLIDQIIYCQAKSNYCQVFLLSGNSILLSKPLKSLVHKLDPYGFIRVHSAYFVNSQFITRFIKTNGGALRLEGNIAIPVSRMHKKTITSWLDSLI